MHQTIDIWARELRMRVFFELGKMSVCVLLAGVFMTPAFAQSPVALTTELRGQYDCGQGQNDMTLRLGVGPNRQIVAQFDFPASAAGVRGSFELAGTMSWFGTVRLEPTRWIMQPPGQSMMTLNAQISPDGQVFRGRVQSPGCKSFSTRVVSGQAITQEYVRNQTPNSWADAPTRPPFGQYEAPTQSTQGYTYSKAQDLIDCERLSDSVATQKDSQLPNSPWLKSYLDKASTLTFSLVRDRAQYKDSSEIRRGLPVLDQALASLINEIPLDAREPNINRAFELASKLISEGNQCAITARLPSPVMIQTAAARAARLEAFVSALDNELAGWLARAPGQEPTEAQIAAVNLVQPDYPFILAGLDGAPRLAARRPSLIARAAADRAGESAARQAELDRRVKTPPVVSDIVYALSVANARRLYRNDSYQPNPNRPAGPSGAVIVNNIYFETQPTLNFTSTGGARPTVIYSARWDVSNLSCRVGESVSTWRCRFSASLYSELGDSSLTIMSGQAPVFMTVQSPVRQMETIMSLNLERGYEARDMGGAFVDPELAPIDAIYRRISQGMQGAASSSNAGQPSRTLCRSLAAGAAAAPGAGAAGAFSALGC